MTASLPGFGYSDTSVAAKLSLDVPADSVDILKNIALYSGDVQANMEAAARFGADFMQYLQLMPQIQRQVLDEQKNMLQVLRDTATAMDQLRSSSYGYGASGMPQMMGSASGYASNMNSDRYGVVRSIPSDVSQSQPTNVGANQGPMAGMTDTQINSYIQRNGSVLNPFGYEAMNPMGGQGGRRVIPGAGVVGVANSGQAANDLTEQSRKDAATREGEAHRQHAVRNDIVNGGRDAGNLARIASSKRRRAAMGLPPEEEESDSEDRTEPDEGSTGESDRTRAKKGKSAKGESEKEDDPAGFNPHPKWHGVLQNVLGGFGNATEALGPDGTPLAGRAALASRVLGGVAGAMPNGIAGLPMAAKMIGGVGLGLGAAGLAFNAVQGVGEQVQDYRNMDVHGHTFAGGAKVESDVMMMSLNPLISTEQSREIIMGALNTGKTGAAYDTAVDFIRTNLVNMNMDVADSVKLLQTNVEEGRASIAGVKFDLNQLAGVASAGGKTVQEVGEQYSQISQFLIDKQGAGGDAAGKMSNQFVADFATKEPDGGVDPLAEKTVPILTGIMNTPSIQGLLTQFAPGVSPNTIISHLTTAGTLNKNVESILSGFATTAKQSANNTETQQKNFFNHLTAEQIPISYGDSNLLYNKLIAGLSDPSESITSQSDELLRQQNSSTITKADGTKVDASTLQTSTAWMKANPGKTQQDYEKAMGLQVKPTPTTGMGYSSQDTSVDSTAIKGIIASGRNVLAIDPEGGKHYLDPNNRDLVIGLSNGTWRLQNTGLDTTGSKGPERTTNESLVLSSQKMPQNTELTGPRVTLKNFNSEGGIVANTPDEGPAGTVSTVSGASNTTTSGPTTTNNPDGSTTINSGTTDSTGAPIIIQIVPSPGMSTYYNIRGDGPGQTPQTQGNSQSNTGYGNVTRNSVAPGAGTSATIPYVGGGGN